MDAQQTVMGNDCVVTFEYILSLDGRVLERTAVGKVKTVLMGYARDLPPGLESSLHGRRAGECYTFELANGYGVFDPQKVQAVPRSAFPATARLEPGEGFYSQDEAGKPLLLRVLGVEDEQVILDANHEHAGKTLVYEVRIHSLRAAEAEELEHGHVHGEGGVIHA